MSDMKDINITILHQCSVTVDSIVKSDVLACRQCLFSYYKTDNLEPGIGNRELISCSLFELTCGIIENFGREEGIGNRKQETGPLFLILVYNTNVSKKQIGNKEPVPGSFLTIIGFMLVSGFVNCISIYGI